MGPQDLAFHYNSAFQDQAIPEAYERLLQDSLEGDAALFIRSDHIEEAWRIVDPLIQAGSNWESYGLRSMSPAPGDLGAPMLCCHRTGMAGNESAGPMKTPMADLHLSRTTEEAFKTLATFIGDLAGECSAQRGRFTIALSGGSTPRGLYQLLASPAYAPRLDWDRWHIFWSDERCVPPEHQDSNYRWPRRPCWTTFLFPIVTFTVCRARPFLRRRPRNTRPRFGRCSSRRRLPSTWCCLVSEKMVIQRPYSPVPWR